MDILSGVSETALITLRARVIESKNEKTFPKTNGLI